VSAAPLIRGETGRGEDAALANAVDAAHTGHDADPDDLDRGRAIRTAQAELVTDCGVRDCRR